MGPKSGWGGPDRLCQTSPIPRSPDGDNKKGCDAKTQKTYECMSENTRSRVRK